MYKQSNSGSGNNKEPPTYKSVVKEKIRNSLSKRPELERFLEDNHAKGRFIRSCVNNVSGVKSFSNYETHMASEMCDFIEKGERPILSCFTWSKTTENWAFWKKLEDKFQGRKE